MGCAGARVGWAGRQSWSLWPVDGSAVGAPSVGVSKILSVCLWCLWWRFLWIFRNSPLGAMLGAEGCLRITSVSPRVRCAGDFVMGSIPATP